MSALRTIGLALIATATAVAAQTPGPPIPKGRNILAGRVLDVGTGAGVSGAIVTLTAYFDASGRPMDLMPRDRLPETLAPRSVATTTDGDYVFRDLPAGRYTLTVAAFGYIKTEYPGEIVELADSEKPTTVPLRVWKGNAISGRVIDEQGEPIVGMPVFALRREVVGGAIVLRREWIDAATDDRGAYRIAPLPPARYVVAVLASSATVPAPVGDAMAAVTSIRDPLYSVRSQLIRVGGISEPGQGLRIGEVLYMQAGPPPTLSADGRVLTYATTLFPGTSSPIDAAIIALGSGESRTGVDIPIRFTPGVIVSGVLSGPDGPLKQHPIQLVPPNAADATDIEPSGISTAVTDAAGNFTFLAVPPGSYTLNAVLVSMATQTTPDVSLSAMQALTVGETDITGVAVTMKTGTRVSGRVDYRSAAGTGPDTRQFRNVMLRPIGAEVWAGVPGQVRPDGTFNTMGVQPGRYLVDMYVPSPWILQSVSRAGQSLPDAVIDLGAEDVTGLVVTVSDRPARLSGSIADAKGNADPDTDVIILPADTTAWREGIINDRRLRRVRASSSAAFEFTAMPAGDYYVIAVRRGPSTTWRDPSFLERLLPGAQKITLRDGDDRAVALRAFTPKAP